MFVTHLLTRACCRENFMLYIPLGHDELFASKMSWTGLTFTDQWSLKHLLYRTFCFTFKQQHDHCMFVYCYLLRTGYNAAYKLAITGQCLTVGLEHSSKQFMLHDHCVITDSSQAVRIKLQGDNVITGSCCNTQHKFSE